MDAADAAETRAVETAQRKAQADLDAAARDHTAALKRKRDLLRQETDNIINGANNAGVNASVNAGAPPSTNFNAPPAVPVPALAAVTTATVPQGSVMQPQLGATSKSRAAAKSQLKKAKAAAAKARKQEAAAARKDLAQNLMDRDMPSGPSTAAAEKLTDIMSLLAKGQASEDTIAAILEQEQDQADVAAQEEIWESVAAEIDNLNSDGTDPKTVLVQSVTRMLDEILRAPRCFKCGSFSHTANSPTCSKYEPRNPPRARRDDRDRSRERRGRSRSRSRDRDRRRR